MPDQLGQQLAANVAGARSPLRKWLYENRTEIARMLASGSGARWQALAKTAAANGVTDEKGNAPSRDAVRRAWQAVERTMMKQPAPSVPAASLPVVQTQPIPKPSPALQVEPAASPPKR